jgi:hypothetical protein
LVERLVRDERQRNIPIFAHVLSAAFHRRIDHASFVSSVLKCAEKISSVDKEVDKERKSGLNCASDRVRIASDNEGLANVQRAEISSQRLCGPA